MDMVAKVDTALVDEYFEKINALGNKALIELGRLLDEYKRKAQHGDWLPLLERLDWGVTKAETYRRIYLELGATNKPNSRIFVNLNQSALILLTAPSTPKDIRDEILGAAETEKLTYKEVKELVDEAKPKRKPKPKITILSESEAKDAGIIPDDDIKAPKPVQQAETQHKEQPVRSNVKPSFMVGLDDEIDDEIESSQPTADLLAQIDALKAENEKLKQQKRPFYGTTQQVTCTKCPNLEHELAQANTKIANHYREIEKLKDKLREDKEDADLCNQIRRYLPPEEWNALMRDIRGEQLVEDEEAA